VVGGGTHRLLDEAGEHMDLEVLGAAVALREGEAVTLHRVLLAPGAEEHLVDGEGGDLRARGLLHDAGGPDKQGGSEGRKEGGNEGREETKNKQRKEGRNKQTLI